MCSSVICLYNESNCIPYVKKSYHTECLLDYGTYRGKVTQLRNTGQGLEATPFFEPQGMLEYQ